MKNPFIDSFRQRLRMPGHSFAESLAFIERHYAYQPCAFRNGNQHNAAGENQGSCKILALAVLEGLNTEEALLAFGEHYRTVLATPDGHDHQNIRQLLTHGLAGVEFKQLPLTRREII